MLRESCARAIANLASGLHGTARIPQRVFDERYKEIYVTDFRCIFSQDSIGVFKWLMETEGARTVAVACFQQSRVSVPERQGRAMDWRDDVFFVSADTDLSTYQAFIRRNWLEYGRREATLEMRPPWLVFGEVLGACSDVGSWYMYCEKFAEIALLGFAKRPDVFSEKRLLNEFRIERLADALNKNDFLGYTGNEGTKRLRDKLRIAYLT